MINLTNKQRRIEINELPNELPDFDNSYQSKDSLIKKWIIDWITSAIRKNQIKENDLLPQKKELSEYLGVSVGTVQSAIRFVEDDGYLKSKQKIGTMISNFTNPNTDIRKLTSKRDKVIENIKIILSDKKYKINHPIPSVRKMSQMLNISTNTTRLAYEYLCSLGIISSMNTRGNDSNYILKQIIEISGNISNINSAETLVTKVTSDIKNLITNNYKIGDKLPAHEDLSQELNVSIKTVHDAIIQLSKEGILLSRRGRYGTIIKQMPDVAILQPKMENSIFASAETAAFYNYQKVEKAIKKLIKDEYAIGQQLPSMNDFSKMLNVSTNSVRKALQNIASQGYVSFSRGRYGGTFIIDIPETESHEAYKWISVNPSFVESIE